MTPAEIVELIKQANPKLLGKIPDARAAKIITAALREIGKQINATDDGAVKIAGLGAFKVRQIEREKEKEGEKISVKKIGFRAAKLKAKAADPA